jgi:hypothetical protein
MWRRARELQRGSRRSHIAGPAAAQVYFVELCAGFAKLPDVVVHEYVSRSPGSASIAVAATSIVLPTFVSSGDATQLVREGQLFDSVNVPFTIPGQP